MDRIFGDTRILTVNLWNQETKVENYPMLGEYFLGGRGVNQSILLEKGVNRDERGIPSRIIFGAGSLSGSSVPGANRLNIDSGNAYNAGIGSGSVGGKAAVWLRFCGYDHLALEGRLKTPKYLLIQEDDVSFIDASDLWGKTISQTDEILRSKHNKNVSIICIGPAGENLVRMAAIHSDKYRAQGRCGLGRILGAMKLKAIVIANAKGTLSFAEHESFEEIVKLMNQKLTSQQELLDAMSSGGLMCFIDGWHSFGMPVRNFQDESLSPEKRKILTGKLFAKMAGKSAHGCFGCPVHCDVTYPVVNESSQVTQWAGIGEADAGWSLGSNLDVTDPASIIKLAALCTDLGLDIDSTGVCMAWAFECYQRGVLSLKDTDGIPLEWGNVNAIEKVIHLIARREGIGDLLAEGNKKASEKVGKGSEAWAIHMKGQDLAEPLRAAKGWALGVVVSPRGGGHLRGAPLPDDRFPFDQYKGQAERVIQTERLMAIADCLGFCNILSQWVHKDFPGLEDYRRLYNAASGKNLNFDELENIAENVVALEKIYNQLHAGFERSDDYAPARVMNEPILSGQYKGQKLDVDHLDKMLTEYYQLNGWDENTGKVKEAEILRIFNSIRKAFSDKNEVESLSS